MKRISIFVIVLLYSVTGALCAQNNSVLNILYQNIGKSSVQMDFSYALNVSGVNSAGNGTVTFQDGAYVMKGNGLQIICDRKTAWVVDQAGKEVIIETPAQGEQSYLDNPALLLVNLTDAFNVSGVTVSGSLYTYNLSPKVNCGVKSAVITIKSQTVPVIASAVFVLSDDEKLDIKIKSMTFSEKKPLTSFFFDISVLDSSWLITDLR